MQTLFYLPFFILGALALFSLILKPCLPRRLVAVPSQRIGICRLLTQPALWQWRCLDYETESVITMVLGLWMVNVVFPSATVCLTSSQRG